MKNSEWLSNLGQVDLSNNKYSQCGEEPILIEIFKNIGTTNKVGVDFGAADGVWLSNSKRLIDEFGWKFLLMDGDNRGNNEVKQEFITAENICKLFNKYNVPQVFDVLSVDVDFNDFYVIKAIIKGGYMPRVILTEFNGTIPNGIDKVIEYDAKKTWDNTDGYGYSYTAGLRLAEEIGYKVIWQQAKTNLFMINAMEGLDWSKINLPVFEHQQYHAHNPNAKWITR